MRVCEGREICACGCGEARFDAILGVSIADGAAKLAEQNASTDTISVVEKYIVTGDV